jgi:hypothetical protein
VTDRRTKDAERLRQLQNELFDSEADGAKNDAPKKEEVIFPPNKT